MQCYGQAAALFPEEPATPAILALVASCGGLDAFRTIVPELSPTFPAPVLLLQHLSPLYPSYLPELLSAAASLPVLEARQDDELLPGCIYVAPPGHHLLVRVDGTLSLSDAEPIHFCRPAADVLLESLASSYGHRAVAGILTGRGRDGARGIESVRRAGGLTIAQCPRTCRAADMPAAAIETGCVDLTLPLHRIGPLLDILFTPGLLACEPFALTA